MSTFWEGASPEEVEENIIDKQEERLLGLSDLVSITSSSSQNAGSIRLEFRTGTDKNEALREVRARIPVGAADHVAVPVVVEIGVTSTFAEEIARQARAFERDLLRGVLGRLLGGAKEEGQGRESREVSHHE